MKKTLQIIALSLLAFSFQLHAGPAMFSQNDFYPLHSTLYPQEFLNSSLKEFQKGVTNQHIFERMRFSATFFGQKASTGTNNRKESVPGWDAVNGRINMLGLLYGNIPNGQTQPSLLATAAAQTYHDSSTLLSNPDYTDINDNMGHFSIQNFNYRKLGARFEFSFRILSDVVIKVEGGVSDLRQTFSGFENMGRTNQSQLESKPADYWNNDSNTVTNSNVQTDITAVDQYLMDNYESIFETGQIDLNVREYSVTGPEDVFISFIWRHDIHINSMKDDGYDHDYIYDDPNEWPKFILTPFFKVTGMLGIGKKADPSKLFSLSTGNNGHHGVSLTAGLSMDFYESIEVSFEAGTSHFFKENVGGMFIPTNENQTGVYPYKTDVSYDPGKTWFFSCGMNAYHFADKLSCYANYVFANHSKDTITLLTADSAFKPEVLEERSVWTQQAINLGFNFDLSPHMTVGVAWQAPVNRRRAYKTNTVALTLAGTF
jgi:hypothetical protein